ncbi:hypothetical protein SAMN05660462_02799 [Proteiniborus ethanoligenes]|uniref:DUF2225 domain-containing protein n=1 Tax=Proteiniborus ethanoligenes TaxID=415015 RepID=A0A1H3SBH5_9FIRM|nr:DUF2225 domain-containing protein [Proteiniborus ethanoligenes]SDZ34891.1 hypothetical protein SAMN05660462_02799 [Proteiniborus ethanoligenes]
MEVDALYDKKVKCPICSKEFITKKMRTSRIRIDRVDGDFMNYYKSENPTKYHVFVCPKCGYAAMESNFNNIRPFEKEIIKENVSSKWREREYSGVRTDEEAIQCYMLAFYCGQLLNLKKLDLGNIALKIAWLYRGKNEEEERRFIQNALELFEQAFYTENLSDTSMDEINIGYLIGELYRRLGNKKEAVLWFGKTVSNPLIKTNPRIEKMTREQWLLAKENENGE